MGTREAKTKKSKSDIIRKPSTEVLGDVSWVPLRNLKSHPDNFIFKESPGVIEILSEDIKRNGLIHPVIVSPTFTILSGHKRVMACKRLKWSKIPIQIYNADPAGELLFLITQNTTRNQLTREQRIGIYRLYAPHILKKGSRTRENIEALAREILVSPHTILKDLQYLKHGKVPTMDELRDAWEKKGRDRMKINLHDTGDGNFILRVEGRNFRFESGPGSMSAVIRDSYKKATSNNFNLVSEQREVEAGGKLRRLRKAMGLTQVVLSDRLGISQSYLAELEGGKHKIEFIMQYYNRASEIFEGASAGRSAR